MGMLYFSEGISENKGIANHPNKYDRCPDGEGCIAAYALHAKLGKHGGNAGKEYRNDGIDNPVFHKYIVSHFVFVMVPGRAQLWPRSDACCVKVDSATMGINVWTSTVGTMQMIYRNAYL